MLPNRSLLICWLIQACVVNMLANLSLRICWLPKRSLRTPRLVKMINLGVHWEHVQQHGQRVRK